jgi:hypothetical protein
MDGKELQEILKDSDIQFVGKYMKMFDRILLYTLAVNFLPEDAINGTVNLWDKVIKNGINQEVNVRNEFMENTPAGRDAKYHSEPDGETLRLHSVKQWKIARNIIISNLKKPDDLADTGFDGYEEV